MTDNLNFHDHPKEDKLRAMLDAAMGQLMYWRSRTKGFDQTADEPADQIYNGLLEEYMILNNDLK